MKITNVTRIDLVPDEVRENLDFYQRDIMGVLARAFFDSGDRHAQYGIEQIAKFSVVVSDPIQRQKLADKVGVVFIDTPTTNRAWRDLIVLYPALFLPDDVLEDKLFSAETFQVTLNGVQLDVETLLANY